MCSALGVVILYLGSVLDVLDMSAAVLASVLVLFAVLELGYAYAGAVYALISLLGFLLLPNKSAALFFVALFGYVPMTKFWFEKRLGKILSWVMKLLLYNVLFGALSFLGAELIGFSTENAYGISPMLILVIYWTAANAVYIVCDILYHRLSFLYIRKYREKIRKLLK